MLYLSSENFDISESKLFKFKNIKKIGEGSYGTVYSAIDTSKNNQIVAIKRMNLAIDEVGIPAETLREIALLKSF